MKLKFEKARINENKEIYELINSYKNDNKSGWSEDYPLIDSIDFDISKGYLYVFKTLQNEIVACLSICDQDDFYKNSSWKYSFENPCVLSRLVVKKSYLGNGLGKLMFYYILTKSEKINSYDGVRLMVYELNESGINIYKKFGFEYVGFFEETKKWLMFEVGKTKLKDCMKDLKFNENIEII